MVLLFSHRYCVCFFIVIFPVDSGMLTFSTFWDSTYFVLSCVQIENEYEPERMKFGSAGEAYMNWAAQMATGLNTGVPWVMCKEYDAPDPVVS